MKSFLSIKQSSPSILFVAGLIYGLVLGFAFPFFLYLIVSLVIAFYFIFSTLMKELFNPSPYGAPPDESLIQRLGRILIGFILLTAFSILSLEFLRQDIIPLKLLFWLNPIFLLAITLYLYKKQYPKLFVFSFLGGGSIITIIALTAYF